MNLSEFVLPRCVCGRRDEWDFTGNSTHEDTSWAHWVCNLCGRPAFFIRHEGGNVCVMPRKQVEEIPDTVMRHIEDTILPHFRMNAYTLERLRELHEYSEDQKIRKKLGMEPGQDWRSLDDRMQMTYQLAVAFIYRELWESPPAFNPAPLPARRNTPPALLRG